ncbi:3-deoxy-D-manno-octulosonic acid transferase [Pedobacter cryophilus]|uniref:3-deoxy-D-manno-octulosonic acid transferase n=1 Tax=Pedobacter cryophilus TaxID=2571271 RepID=A0A4U1C2Y0_9SPHI|nr:glycosyltransferase N-terminal domain-containing protein [Pedobacter cryophilus]TKC00120.1 3-deoxy-D-manno-octulosonic acid transferase [Pedobacter cryophilus]
MFTIYFFGIKFYNFLVWIFSFFNKKAEKWISGRKNWKNKFNPDLTKKRIWFHFASLGEFEQGKPLLQAIKNQFPEKEVLITFFSPSGYEVRKNSPLGDMILYLPLDTPKNAKDFIEIFRPEMAIFNKYEYWYCFFKALNHHQIPLYITSSIFRPHQIFFKWYGGFNRKILSYVTYFYVQNEESGKLLEGIGLKNYTLSGDTRFDSVLDLAKNRKDFPLIEKFKGSNKLLIAGSTWPQDEELLVKYIKASHHNWKFVFAPHEISEAKLIDLEKMIGGDSIRYSVLKERDPLIKISEKVLIINNIGMLSSLYHYGEIAYIGGGFGSGIHNTLEAAAWGLPIIFGPKYHKFQEAKDLIKKNAGFSITDFEQLSSVLEQLVNDTVYLTQCGNSAKNYVERNTGATATIMNSIFNP